MPATEIRIEIRSARVSWAREYDVERPEIPEGPKKITSLNIPPWASKRCILWIDENIISSCFLDHNWSIINCKNNKISYYYFYFYTT